MAIIRHKNYGLEHWNNLQVFAETMDGARENEDFMMKLIAGAEDDGSQFLNDSGEGMEEQDLWDGSGEGMEGDGSGEGTLTTKSGEVY